MKFVEITFGYDKRPFFALYACAWRHINGCHRLVTEVKAIFDILSYYTATLA